MSSRWTKCKRVMLCNSRWQKLPYSFSSARWSLIYPLLLAWWPHSIRSSSFFLSLCFVHKRGHFLVFGCANLLCQRHELEAVGRLPDHHPVCQATVVSVSWRVTPLVQRDIMTVCTCLLKTSFSSLLEDFVNTTHMMLFYLQQDPRAKILSEATSWQAIILLY